MNKHKQKKFHNWRNTKKKSHPSWRPLLPTQNPGRGTLWDFPPLQNTIGTSAIHHRGFQINWKRRPKSKEQRVGKTWNKVVKRRFWQNVAGSTCHVALRQNGSEYILFFFKKFISHFTSWLRKTSIKKTSQELRMLSRSQSDCKSLLLTVMIQVSQCLSVIVSSVTKSLIH